MTRVRVNISGLGRFRAFHAALLAVSAVGIPLLYAGDSKIYTSAMPISVIMLANALAVLDVRLEYDECVFAACGYAAPEDICTGSLCSECGAPLDRPERITMSRPWRQVERVIGGAIVALVAFAMMIVHRL